MRQTTCSIDGCEEPHMARTYCRSHYNRWYATGAPLPTSEPSGRCLECGNPTPFKGKTGPRPQYCSAACKRAVISRRTSDRMKDKVAARRAAGAFRCQWPGCTTPLLAHETKWCADHVKTAARKSGPDSHEKTCTHDGCDRPLRANGECSMHNKRTLRAQGKMQNPWNDRRRNNWHTRRARIAGATQGDAVTISDLIARDGINCSACGEPIDMTLEWPDRYSKSIDHTIPVSKGGIHALSNTTLMHLTCNASKGARLTTKAALSRA